MDISDFRLQVLDEEITRLDLFLHKGLDWVEHSTADTDTLFEEIASEWDYYSSNEKVEILLEFVRLYRG